MRLLPRRRPRPLPATSAVELLEAYRQAEPAAEPVVSPDPRVERALHLLALAVVDLHDRLDTIERRLDDVALRPVATPDDIAALRTQTTRLANELARCNIELRGDLARAVTELSTRRTA